MAANDEQATNEVPMKDGRPDVEALMGRIRARARQSVERGGPPIPRYVPPAALLFDGSVSPLLYSDELNYLNAHWGNWTDLEPITSHRRYLGPWIVKAKTWLRNFLITSLLKPYFERSRQFQMNLVRHLNASARYIDARDTALFWQLVHKMDSDISAINDRCDLLFAQACGEVYRIEKEEIQELRAALRRLQSQSAEIARL